jgi:NAD(P)-dependent dehydrogenase (short-subunit alcohol dehydrogenase family)
MRFDGKVCVVTGASSGIGRRTAFDLARAGAKVCLAARREDRLIEVLEEIGGTEAGHSYKVTDVSDRAQVDALASHVEATYGRCDVLINNAGFSRGMAFEGKESLGDLDAVMGTNLFGAVNCVASFLPLLERSAPASVVNVASVAGRLAYGLGSAYCSSKFALVGWSEAARFDLEPQGIYVSLVEPGPVPTEGFPQKGLVKHPLFRGALASDGDVSRAIQAAIKGRLFRRTVPRWYYLLQFVKLLTPRFYRFAVRKLVTPARLPEQR